MLRYAKVTLTCTLIGLFGLLFALQYQQTQEARQEIDKLAKSNFTHTQQLEILNTDIFRFTKKTTMLKEKVTRLREQLQQLSRDNKQQTERLGELHRQQYQYFRKRCPKSICPEKFAFWYTGPGGGTYRCCDAR